MLTITLPPTITSIESEAFLDCKKLYAINFAPNSTTEMKIARSICHHCYNLKYINIPDYVTSIGSEAFLYSGLKMVILGNSVSYIGDLACPSDVAICQTPIPPIAGQYPFGSISKTIIVPCESVEAYTSAPNLDFYDYSTCIGLEDIVKENIDFTVYPNPAKDNITISTKQLEGGILSLYDIMGKEILRRRINNDETILDINRLKTGVYILKVLNSENIIAGNKKIIKQ
ncbi:MAG: leucine-rich repeat protein [Bacilli bacterium]